MSSTPDKNPEEVLRQEILADARRQAERLLRKAKKEVEDLAAAAEKSVADERAKTVGGAEAAARRRTDLVLAKVPVEEARIRAARAEAVLDAVRDDARARLEAEELTPERLLALIAEAVRLVGSDCVVALSKADRERLAAIPSWQKEAAASLPCSVELADKPLPDDSKGPVVTAKDGSAFYDNRLSVRLARMWPALRCEIAEKLGLSAAKPEGAAAEAETAETAAKPTGPYVSKVSGPIVTARGMEAAQMFEVVKVGEDGLIGEVVRLDGGKATVQVYEDTTLLRPGAPVVLTGAPLSVCLGPGLIGNIYDGIQRPLPAIQSHFGAWIGRGGDFSAIDLDKRWPFTPAEGLAVGSRVSGGTILGTVPETDLFTHSVMVPPGVEGVLRTLAPAGDYTLRDTIAVVATDAGDREIALLQKWPVRVPRPTRERLRIDAPLVTGQRIIDTLFPIGKGGTAAIPGGFGTGKTCTQHQLAKWSDADIIVYIGCGERGNEMTDVLREFPEIVDPKSGHPLMERTILIANTSNMPVAAREVSIYTGITLAEYYRDMGCSVAVFADSTSRWAEALRELAARLEEMPAEEGFPATLPTRLAQFYERAGSFETLGGRRGAISIVGAVSPPGGDFSEPVTQHTQRFIRCFWALDSELANARHYPSINWLRSYSEYGEDVADWWARRAPDWGALRAETIQILQREDRLQQIVKLVGPDVLPDSQRLILFVAEMIKDGFLTQSAFDPVDMYCSPERQMTLLRLILAVYRKGGQAIEAGAPLLKVQQLDCVPQVVRAKATYGNDQMEDLALLENTLHQQLDALIAEYRKQGGAR